MSFSFYDHEYDLQLYNMNMEKANDVRQIAGIQEENGNSINKQTFVSQLVSDVVSENTSAENTVATVPRPLKYPDDISMSARTGVEQSVLSFLKRPFRLSTGSFATTDALPTYNLLLTMPNAFFSQTRILDKLQGSAFVTGTMKFTLVVNANRFQRGLYRLFWIPTGGTRGFNVVNSPYSAKALASAGFVTTVSQYPGVYIDLNCDTEVSFSMPMANSQMGYLVETGATGAWSNGGIAIAVISALSAVSGPTIADYTLWAHFEDDVKVSYPIVPQAPDIEKEEAESGIISGPLRKIARASAIVKGIPLLSSAASTTEWFTSAMANAAAAFGFSSPKLLIDKFDPMYQYSGQFIMNADVPRMVSRLGIVQNVSADLPSGVFGTDLDEMSIEFLATMPAIFTTLSWAAADVTGTTLTSFRLAPNTFVQADALNTKPLPIAWIARPFSLWRCGFRITLRIVKTEFHSGRLLVAFFPRVTGIGTFSTSRTITDADYVHKQIVDVRLGNLFQFDIPYAGLTQFLYNIHNSDAGCYGYFSIFVLNDLVAPATVTSSVQLVIEVSALPDAQFVAPFRTLPQHVITSQSCDVSVQMLGNMVDSNFQAARYTATDVIKSIRQMLKKVSGKSLSVGLTSNPTMTLLPFVAACSQDGFASSTNPWTNLDYYDYFVPGYALAHGSIRINMTTRNSSNSGECSYLTISTSPTANTVQCGVASSTTNVFTAYTLNTTVVPTNIGSQIHAASLVEIPPYTMTYAWPTADVTVPNLGALTTYTSNIPTNGLIDTGIGQIVATCTSTSSTGNLVFFRSVGEDFYLGRFWNTPVYTTATWNAN